MSDGLTRREVILGAAALLVAPLTGAAGRVLAGEKTDAVLLGKVADFTTPGVKPVEQFCVVTTADGLYCLSRKCTHKFVLIDFDIKQDKFVCPAHGAMFDKEGTVLKKPAKSDLPRYALEKRGEELYVLPGSVVPKGTLLKLT